MIEIKPFEGPTDTADDLQRICLWAGMLPGPTAAWKSGSGGLELRLSGIIAGVDYSTGSCAHLVHSAAQASHTSPTVPAFKKASSTRQTESTPIAVESFLNDRDFRTVLETQDDQLRFVALLTREPALLNRTRALIDMVGASEYVESVRVEVDEEDDRVIVWAHLNVDDEDRLPVQMQLFEEAEGILGPLSDFVLLAMI